MYMDVNMMYWGRGVGGRRGGVRMEGRREKERGGRRAGGGDGGVAYLVQFLDVLEVDLTLLHQTTFRRV